MSASSEYILRPDLPSSLASSIHSFPNLTLLRIFFTAILQIFFFIAFRMFQHVQEQPFVRYYFPHIRPAHHSALSGQSFPVTAISPHPIHSHSPAVGLPAVFLIPSCPSAASSWKQTLQQQQLVVGNRAMSLHTAHNFPFTLQSSCRCVF